MQSQIAETPRYFVLDAAPMRGNSIGPVLFVSIGNSWAADIA